MEKEMILKETLLEIEKYEFDEGSRYVLNGTEFIMIERDKSLSLNSRVLKMRDVHSNAQIKIGSDNKTEMFKLGWWIIKSAINPWRKK
jgi:hypothetical protein